MSSSDLRDKLDGLSYTGKMDAVYPEPLSRHNRCLTQLSSNMIECNPHMYKRTVKKKMDRKGRFRTQPVTFMEIKEVDEEKGEEGLGGNNTLDLSNGEKSRSEMDLKAKFDDVLSRNLVRRTNSGSRKRLDIPESARETCPLSEDGEEKVMRSLEEEESRDTVNNDFSLRIQVNYPQGFSLKSRPSF